MPAAADIARLDWPQLMHACEEHLAHRLGGDAHRIVPGTGDRAARWMVVGEAPGANEDRAGEPFVGQAGRLLDHMLAAIGLSRRAQETGDGAAGVYITNVLKWRPHGNRNPLPDEIAECGPFLEREIALLRPRVILAMGRFAAQWLLGSDQPVGRLRGRVHDRRGVAVVVTYHPAYLLRAPAEKARAWQDLCLAHSVMAGGAVSPAAGDPQALE